LPVVTDQRWEGNPFEHAIQVAASEGNAPNKAETAFEDVVFALASGVENGMTCRRG